MEFKDLKVGDTIAKDFLSEQYLVFEITETKPKCKIIGGKDELVEYPHNSFEFIGGILV